MVDLKTLTSTEQMILDELRDIKRTLNNQADDLNPILEEINSKLANIESLIADKDQQNVGRTENRD